MEKSNVLPLQDIRVLDFSTLLPGPLASLILAEAGAEVIKVERPGGEDMRGYPPQLDGTGGGFVMLNRGKRAIEIDLREEGAAKRLLELAPTIDIVLEQFRPRRDGAARPGLRGLAREEPAHRLLRDHRLWPGRAARAGGGPRHELRRARGPAGPRHGARTARRASTPRSSETSAAAPTRRS